MYGKKTERIPPIYPYEVTSKVRRLVRCKTIRPFLPPNSHVNWRARWQLHSCSVLLLVRMYGNCDANANFLWIIITASLTEQCEESLKVGLGILGVSVCGSATPIPLSYGDYTSWILKAP